ncbi:MAG: 16S rRNA (guanine(966)-N(2))-methyltransferase RsmD [Hungatella sp.]
MRVIAGSARRLLLKTIDGIDTRPTTDRLKETLFNMINPDLYGCRFLDLFSGSGGIGIEALSRGADWAVLIEQNPKALACIRENLKNTGLEDRSLLILGDVLTGLKRLEDKGSVFDIVFMDPPYGQNLERMVLEYLKTSDLIHEESTVIVEASLDTDFSYLHSMGFSMKKAKKYKTNQHVFLAKGAK